MDTRWPNESVETFTDTAKAMASAVMEVNEALHQVAEHWGEYFSPDRLRHAARTSYDYAKAHPIELVLVAGMGIGLSYLLLRNGGMLRRGAREPNVLDID